MARSTSRLLGVVVVVATLGIGCGLDSQRPSEQVPGIEELSQPLNPLASTPAFASGALTVAIAAGEIGVISKHPVSGAIFVNDVATGATSTTLKTIAVTMTGASPTLILDFANGSFAPGTSSAVGIAVTWDAATTPAFKLRGSSTGTDTITVGHNASSALIMGFTSDANADLSFTTAPANSVITFSLGGGNDVFGADTASAVKYLGASATQATETMTVYGGLGNDTFSGGGGVETFYGEDGDDTFKVPNAAANKTKYFYGGPGTGDTADLSTRSADLTFEPDSAVTADSGDLAASETIKIDDKVEILKGGSGDDTFLPNTNEGHTFYGGTGTDVVDYSAIASDITVTMANNAADDGAASDNIRDDVEDIKCAAANACTVTGNAKDNTLWVAASTSVAHAFKGGTGVDTVNFSAFGAAIDITMDYVASTAPAGMKVDTDVENVVCPGAAFDCSIVGNASANHFFGTVGGAGTMDFSTGGGDDVIDGVEDTSGSGGTADVVDCGSGSDIFVTDSSNPLARPASCEL